MWVFHKNEIVFLNSKDIFLLQWISENLFFTILGKFKSTVETSTLETQSMVLIASK